MSKHDECARRIQIARSEEREATNAGWLRAIGEVRGAIDIQSWNDTYKVVARSTLRMVLDMMATSEVKSS